MILGAGPGGEADPEERGSGCGWGVTSQSGVTRFPAPLPSLLPNYVVYICGGL